MVLRDHVEVARFGRVMRGLFGNVVCACLVGKVPVAGEDFPKDGVQGLLDARGTDVPAAEVELDNG